MNDETRIPFDDLTFADDHSMTWQDEPFNGTAYETNAHGQVIGEARYKDGLQHGLTREWFDAGGLRSESEYERGVRHGTSRSWDPSGRLRAEAEHAYSIKVREKTWDDRGSLTLDWRLPADDEQHALIELLSKRFEP